MLYDRALLQGAEELIYFDGTYRLKPIDQEPPKPIREWTCAWRVRIINYSMSQPEVQHLRPIAIYAVQTGGGHLKTTCAESLGKRICRDFDLDIYHILWVEQIGNVQENFFVATFIQRPYMGPESYDSVSWRPIHQNELVAIKPYIPEISDMA